MRFYLAVGLFIGLAGIANAEPTCVVNDPTPTPLNVRSAPYGVITGIIENGLPVTILDHAIDRNGRPWVYIALDGQPKGWVYRDYIDCPVR